MDGLKVFCGSSSEALTRKIAAYLAALGLERNGDPWEIYISDPTRVPEPQLLTDVYYPVRND
jgi:effector-binding domain-containing protein